MNFEKFDEIVDLQGLRQDVLDNTGYKKVPYGTYEVEVAKMELTESKAGDPMVSIWFKIVRGECSGQFLFFNQVVTKGFQIGIVNELLNNMRTNQNIEFMSFTQYSKLLENIFEEINGKIEFALDYNERKGYDLFRITEVFQCI